MLGNTLKRGKLSSPNSSLSSASVKRACRSLDRKKCPHIAYRLSRLEGSKAGKASTDTQGCSLGQEALELRHYGVTINIVLFACATSSSAFAEVTPVPGQYVPQPYSPGWEVWFGAFAAAIPFVIGGWEFGKRIVIQRRCKRCQGSGLVRKRKYRSSMDVRKCPDCGGFFPWQGWGRFLTSTAAPGNGGPLQQPKGQTSIFYRVPAAESDDNDDNASVSEQGKDTSKEQTQDKKLASQNR